MAEKIKPRVCVANHADYKMFLTEIYNYVFPPLLQKSLDFYKWFYTTKEPTQIFSRNDITDVIEMLKGSDMDQ